MFVDASAIVAIVTGEPEADALADRLEQAATPITSPLAVYEAMLAVRRIHRTTVSEAYEIVKRFLAATSVLEVAIDPRDTEMAVDAFARYGKGQGHPAQLNMADCFAYAVARNRQRRLLYKGNDFAKTDMASGPAVH